MITLSEITNKIQRLQGKNDWYTILYDLFEMAAIAISNQVDLREPYRKQREDQYLKTINKYDKKEQKLLVEITANLWELLGQMSEPKGVFDDYLGKLYMASGTSSSHAGQFFTPYNVSKLCAEMSITENSIKEHLENNPDYIFTMNEPACGSGGLVLAGVEALRNKGVNYARNLLVVCGDIDLRCVYMAYIQLSLAGVPAIILHQNALTLETWSEWHTPAYCFQYLRFRNRLNGGVYKATPEEYQTRLEEAKQTAKEKKSTKQDKPAATPQILTPNKPLEEIPINTQEETKNPKKENNEPLTLFDFEL